jgi:hypothetical protein
MWGWRKKIRFGRAKSYSNITLADYQRHPIWTSAHDARHDEESAKPIVSTDEVTREIVDDPLIVPMILIQAEDSEVYGTAWCLPQNREIFAISIWHGGQWRTLRDVPTLAGPLVFVSVPKILGQEGVRFLCKDPADERADQIV